jgi:hypothetical protein
VLVITANAAPAGSARNANRPTHAMSLSRCGHGATLDRPGDSTVAVA